MTITTLLAQVPAPLAKSLKKRLIDEDVSYKKWLIARIEEYVKPGKGRRV